MNLGRFILTALTNVQGRRPDEKLAQSEASECEAVGLGKREKRIAPEGRHTFTRCLRLSRSDIKKAITNWRPDYSRV